MSAVTFVLNGKNVSMEADPADRLLDLIRDDLHLKGTKEGCGSGQCGACTVLLDGEPVASCLLMGKGAEGKHVTTIEGLKGDPAGEVLMESFCALGGVQCGFCTPGMILSAWALLQANPDPSVEEIKEALSGNLCRCTGYLPIIRAVEDAAKKLRTGQTAE